VSTVIVSPSWIQGDGATDGGSGATWRPPAHRCATSASVIRAPESPVLADDRGGGESSRHAGATTGPRWRITTPSPATTRRRGWPQGALSHLKHRAWPVMVVVFECR